MANGEARNRVKGASGCPWANIPDGSAGSQLFQPGSGRLRWYSVRPDAGDRKRTTRPRDLCASPLPQVHSGGHSLGCPWSAVRTSAFCASDVRPTAAGWRMARRRASGATSPRRASADAHPPANPGGQRAARGCCRRPLVGRRLRRRALHRLWSRFVNLTARGTLVVPVLDPRDGRLRRTVRVIVGLYRRDEALIFRHWARLQKVLPSTQRATRSTSVPAGRSRGAGCGGRGSARS